MRKVKLEHWYANFGYYAVADEAYPGPLYLEGGRLCKLNPRTGQLVVLLDDPRGGVRDPQPHYDGTKILFSYRKGGSKNYHLFEINADGSGLRQLTDGPWDDIEPTYLPDGHIVFVSSRCKRWVNCYMTHVAVLYRCDGDGKNILQVSSNIEHDNTPWPLPDGRILFTRWEYVDRYEMTYHHLWVVNPDGTRQMVFYGNQRPGLVMIDGKPIPGSGKIVASFSPGHGKPEHAGAIAVVDPKAGPDAAAAVRIIGTRSNFRDPWAFSENAFMAARGSSLVFLDDEGRTNEIFSLSPEDARAGYQCHEPRPLQPRARETVVVDLLRPEQTTGQFLLINAYDGRNMAGVKPGSIKKLLVLETLPKPINIAGGMEPISYGGTFTLERILGTVPVEPDGSAYFEAPALRSLFFVALDKNDLAVKRMQSFTSVQPGETTSCVGCHEPRTQTPRQTTTFPLAARRAVSKIEPIADVPEVFDFPRDVQPILDNLCVSCHGYDKTPAGGPYAGRLILSGDHGPVFSHSYYLMTMNGLFSDAHNGPGNRAPNTLGSSASRILRMLDGSHHGVRATAWQKKMLRLWIDSGAVYAGTYGSLGTGIIGAYIHNKQRLYLDFGLPTTRTAANAIDRRCGSCHNDPSYLLPLPLAVSDERSVAYDNIGVFRLNACRNIAFNLSRPKKSLMLLAPLADAAGGWGLCRDPKTREKVSVFADTADPDYQKILAMIRASSAELRRIRRFDMPGFRPRPEYIREMKRYGVLPASFDADRDPVDVYEIDRQYWRSLWYRPSGAGSIPENTSAFRPGVAQ